MDIFEQIIKIIGGLGQVGTLIVAVLLYQAGFFDNFTKKGDGKQTLDKGTEDDKFVDLKLSIDTIQNNHLSHISDKLDKVIEQNQEQLFILRDIKDGQKIK